MTIPFGHTVLTRKAEEMMSDLYVMATIYNHVYLPTLKPVFLYVLLTNIVDIKF